MQFIFKRLFIHITKIISLNDLGHNMPMEIGVILLCVTIQKSHPKRCDVLHYKVRIHLLIL